MAQLVKDRDQFGVTFADPAKPLDTTRVKQSSQTKRIQTVVVDSSTLEIVGLRQAPVGADVSETLSCRVILKGATKNQEAAVDLAKDVMGYAATVLDGHGFSGFDPVTGPIY